MITIKRFTVNPLEENSYLLSDESGECLIVDAGFYFPGEKEEITAFIAEAGLTPVGLINTHCHFDHLMGVEYLRKKYGIPFSCPFGEEYWLSRASKQAAMFGFRMEDVAPADSLLTEGEPVRFGNSLLEVIWVPGHSAGHVVFYSGEGKFLLSGDVLFRGSIGRSDLHGGNYAQLMRSIGEKLLILPPETTVWPGHGSETTIGTEKVYNPFLV
ncbi:MAG TPA: MBL fold metallo-hydrolase [Prolixibacteraceae bacterium]|nr:MBL fold metallo-hydrolase [Prolixibacteraceae bacterium]HOR99792.1 MBL fold metallo-hydrolase [Prolixibacteraceae bacterium]